MTLLVTLTEHDPTSYVTLTILLLLLLVVGWAIFKDGVFVKEDDGE